MKNLKLFALIGLCIACCITESNGFFSKLFKPHKFPDIFKTIGVPITLPPPFRKPFFPWIPEKPITTTPPTTTTPPPPPPPTTVPPPPSTLHPDDIIIEICNEDIRECPWSTDELVAKIIERQNIDTSIEFNGEGKSVGPTINPSKVGDRLKPEIGATVSPGHGTGTSGIGGTTNGVPNICIPFGKKSRSPIAYIINCINYLSDTTIPHYTSRRNAMLGCFKCRYLCELGSLSQYL